MNAMKNSQSPWRKRVYEMIEVASPTDPLSRVYDLLNTLSIVVNLTASILYTFAPLREGCGGLLLAVEGVTVVFFTLDYGLRLWTAQYRYPDLSPLGGTLRYARSFSGIVDVLSFLPYFLPFLFPAGAVAFRMFRVMRIFRLFRVNAYYDSLNVIAEVISSKRQQLLSSVFIIVVLMLASSLCMYSLEHEAQPEVFTNAFSGIWWAVSTLLTVGYGDIYPITTMGKVFSIVITFLGVGMVAIPTGIISAGFVDQYSRIKRLSEYAREDDLLFIPVRLAKKDAWTGKALRELGLPAGMVAVAVQRGSDTVLPRGGVVLLPGDILILGAEALAAGGRNMDLKKLTLGERHPWNGARVRELDISRQTLIVMVKRGSRTVVPNGDTTLRAGDRLFLYTRAHLGEEDVPGV